MDWRDFFKIWSYVWLAGLLGYIAAAIAYDSIAALIMIPFYAAMYLAHVIPMQTGNRRPGGR